MNNQESQELLDRNINNEAYYDPKFDIYREDGPNGKINIAKWANELLDQYTLETLDTSKEMSIMKYLFDDNISNPNNSYPDVPFIDNNIYNYYDSNEDVKNKQRLMLENGVYPESYIDKNNTDKNYIENAKKILARGGKYDINNFSKNLTYEKNGEIKNGRFSRYWNEDDYKIIDEYNDELSSKYINGDNSDKEYIKATNRLYACGGKLK